MVVANAGNSTACVGSWHFIRETFSAGACRFTQGNGTSWVSVWVGTGWVNLYQAYINNADFTSTSTIVVYYR